MSYDAWSLLSNPTSDPDFNRILREVKRRAVCGRPYVRVQKLKAWLRQCSSRTVHTQNHTNFQRILEKIHQHSSKFVDIPALLLEGNDAQEKSRRLDLTFSILMVLGRPDLLADFQDVNVRDHALPIALESLKTALSRLEISDPVDLAEQFDCLQWSFTPIVFEPEHVHLLKKHIVPIHRKEALRKSKDGMPVSRGGTSHMYVVEVFEEFLSPALKEDIPESRFCPKTDELGPRYQFVMKSLKRNFNPDYRNEVRNLQALKKKGDALGVILYLGSFRHDYWPAHEDNCFLSNTNPINPVDPQNHLATPAGPATAPTQDTISSHIFFEYGDGDLLHLFECSSPSHPQEIQAFWRDLIRVVQALADIHHLPNPGQVRKHVGVIHADIKPENIISVRDQLKLADLGFSQVLYKESGTELMANITGFTEPYAAPECMDRKALLTQAIDIWSLGCVLSLAATWLVRGADGIDDFKGFRSYAVDRFLSQQSKQQASQPPSTGRRPSRGDYFHNGVSVLPEILEWHELLRSSLHVGDIWTAKVLDIVDKRMFLKTPEKRILAKELYDELSSLIETDSTAAEMPESIQSYFEKHKGKAKGAKQDGIAQEQAKEDDAGSKKRLKAHRLEYIPSSRTTQPTDRRRSYVPTVAPVLDPPPPRVSDLPGLPTEDLRHAETLESSAIVDIASMTDLSFSPPLNRTSYNAQFVEPSPSEADRSKRTRIRQKIQMPENPWQALGNMRKAKSNSGMFGIRLSGSTKLDERIEHWFSSRDIIFLVDNRETMIQYWDEVYWLLEILLLKTKNFDKNGKDLFFTCDTQNKYAIRSEKRIESLLERLDNKKVTPQEGMTVDIASVLRGMFSQHLAALDEFKQEHKNGSSKPKKSIRKSISSTLKFTKQDDIEMDDEKPIATLIFLTDGMWYKDRPRAEYDAIFRDFTTDLKRRGCEIYPTSRPYSVEFVRFGDNEDAAELLEHLDDDLKYDGIPDIIDTEIARDGDVYKMLLGSVDPYYDSVDGEETPHAQLQRNGASQQSHITTSDWSRSQAAISPPISPLPRTAAPTRPPQPQLAMTVQSAPPSRSASKGSREAPPNAAASAFRHGHTHQQPRQHYESVPETPIPMTQRNSDTSHASPHSPSPFTPPPHSPSLFTFPPRDSTYQSTEAANNGVAERLNDMHHQGRPTYQPPYQPPHQPSHQAPYQQPYQHDNYGR